ncbi:hypothetical protein ACFXPX_04760 [Kitasatospora sp. NPDC059146]
MREATTLLHNIIARRDLTLAPGDSDPDADELLRRALERRGGGQR